MGKDAPWGWGTGVTGHLSPGLQDRPPASPPRSILEGINEVPKGNLTSPNPFPNTKAPFYVRECETGLSAHLLPAAGEF